MKFPAQNTNGAMRTTMNLVDFLLKQSNANDLSRILNTFSNKITEITNSIQQNRNIATL